MIIKYKCYLGHVLNIHQLLLHANFYNSRCSDKLRPVGETFDLLITTWTVIICLY